MHGLKMARKTNMAPVCDNQHDATYHATRNYAIAPQNKNKTYGSDLQEMLNKTGTLSYGYITS